MMEIVHLRLTGLHTPHLYTAPQMLLVTDGTSSPSGYYLTSTEVLALPGGEWRRAGGLPSNRKGPTAASLHGVLHVSGGTDGLTSTDILFWDPVSEKWAVAGHMNEAI